MKDNAHFGEEKILKERKSKQKKKEEKSFKIKICRNIK